MHSNNKSDSQISPPNITIDDLHQINTVDFRASATFSTADPDGQVPDVVLASAPPNPMDRYRSIEQRVGIYADGARVGAFTLVQMPTRTWLRDSSIASGTPGDRMLGLTAENRQGERLAVAAYLGVIVAAHGLGRYVESDPMGLSPDPQGISPANRVWESLVRRGAAEVIPDTFDKHGNPRYRSRLPSAQ